LLRRKSTDLSVFTQVFLNQEYRPVVDFIDKHWSRERVLEIVDAGGYTGMTTIYFHQFFQKARVVILEPNARNFELLKRHIEVNHLENVFPICAGLWNTDTKLAEGEKFRDGGEWSFSVRPAGGADEEVVDGISLDSLMKRYAMDSVDILKMDVEGAEREIFQDEEQVSRLLSRARCLAIEIHEEYDKGGRLQELLRKNSFEWIKSGELTIGYNTRRNG
jgi:FkbM family methyltransferase